MAVMHDRHPQPFHLVVTGEAEAWRSALDKIIGQQWLTTTPVTNDHELVSVVRSGRADAAVLGDSAELGLDAMQLLRLVRRINALLPVVVILGSVDRRRLEDAMRLTAFSVVSRPLQLEELLRQVQRMMVRMNRMLRE